MLGEYCLVCCVHGFAGLCDCHSGIEVRLLVAKRSLVQGETKNRGPRESSGAEERGATIRETREHTLRTMLNG